MAGKEGKCGQFKLNGSKVVRAQIAYTLNGGHKSEEWYLTEAVVDGKRVTGKLPLYGRRASFLSLIQTCRIS